MFTICLWRSFLIMRRTKYTFELPSSTLIDLVITKGDKAKVEKMTIADAMRIKHKKGFRYQHFQIGFHTFKTNV